MHKEKLLKQGQKTLVLDESGPQTLEIATGRRSALARTEIEDFCALRVKSVW